MKKISKLKYLLLMFLTKSLAAICMFLMITGLIQYLDNINSTLTSWVITLPVELQIAILVMGSMVISLIMILASRVVWGMLEDEFTT